MAVVIKSGFWGDSYPTQSTKKNMDIVYSRLLRTFAGKKQQALLAAMINETAGTISSTTKRVAHVTTPTGVGALGGARSIETRTFLSAAVAAGDRTLLSTLVQLTRKPSTYAVDLSGNGAR